MQRSTIRPHSFVLAVVSLLAGLAPLQAGEMSRAEMAQLWAAHDASQKSGICELHHHRMELTWVRVRIGEALPPGPTNPSFYDRLLHFPNYVEFIEGGCTTPPGTRQEVWICLECRKAAEAWEKRAAASK